MAHVEGTSAATLKAHIRASTVAVSHGQHAPGSSVVLESSTADEEVTASVALSPPARSHHGNIGGY